MKDHLYLTGGHLISVDGKPILEVGAEYPRDIVEFDDMIVGGEPTRIVCTRPGTKLIIVNSRYRDDPPNIEGFSEIEGEFVPMDTHEQWRFDAHLKSLRDQFPSRP